MNRSTCSARHHNRAGKASWEAVISTAVAVGSFALGVFTWWEDRSQSRTASAAATEKTAVDTRPPVAAKPPDSDVERPEASADPSVAPQPLKLSNGDTFYCYRNLSTEEAHRQVERAVIVISNFHAPYTADFFQGIMDLARAEHKDRDTLIVVPVFQTAPGSLRPGEPHWPSNWEVGAGFAGARPISSFQVIDELFARVTDPGRFPAMRTVVVAGNAMAGTFVNRYLAAARPVMAGGSGGRTIDVNYVVIGAGSYLYLDRCRPTEGSDQFAAPDAGACADFDAYPYGLEARTGYLGRIAARTLRENMFSRSATYVVGALDKTKERLDVSCGAMRQGENRYERALNYWNYIRRFPEWKEHVEFVPLKNMKHISLLTTDSRTVRALLFGAHPKANRSATPGSSAPSKGKSARPAASGPRQAQPGISEVGAPKVRKREG